jgi:hypothetical protein
MYLGTLVRNNKDIEVRVEVFVVMKIQVMVFWVVMSCSDMAGVTTQKMT